ncbi:MAG: amidase family protein, partial [Pirellulales bacterium]
AAFMWIIGNRIDAAALMATGPRSKKGFRKLIARRDEIIEHMRNTSKQFDAILCPVSSLPALQHGAAARLVAAASPCLLANLVDLPAGVVPVTRVSEGEQSGRHLSFDRVLRTAVKTDDGSVGLPIGVQVIGLNGDPVERTVLGLMQAIESRVHFSR